MSITVEELEAHCKSIADLRNEIDADKAALSKKSEQLEEMELKAIAMLKDLNKTSYKSNHGQIIRTEKWRVNLPQSDEDRAAFFQYLKDKGLFDKMISVNANTLNSFWKQEFENVKENAPEEALTFSIPGIGEPKLHETLSFRRS